MSLKFLYADDDDILRIGECVGSTFIDGELITFLADALTDVIVGVNNRKVRVLRLEYVGKHISEYPRPSVLRERNEASEK